MRLVDAEVLKENLMKNIGLTNGMEIAFRETPTIDAEPVKHGKWITEEKDCIYGKKIRLKCSECGDTFDVSETAYPYERFCRYCGARMDEE